MAFTSPSSAEAQELVQRFINPSFGGNPFYSDHLLGVATAQRPERPREEREQLTDAQRFAQQIQSRLLSALSSSIVQAITGAAPGTTGEFTVGEQTIFFERTLTEIRLIITDNNTGERTEIVIPVLNLGNRGGAPSNPGRDSSPTPGISLGGGSGAELLTPAGRGGLGARGTGSSLTQGSLEPQGVTDGGLKF